MNINNVRRSIDEFLEECPDIRLEDIICEDNVISAALSGIYKDQFHLNFNVVILNSYGYSEVELAMLVYDQAVDMHAQTADNFGNKTIITQCPKTMQ